MTAGCAASTQRCGTDQSSRPAGRVVLSPRRSPRGSGIASLLWRHLNHADRRGRAPGSHSQRQANGRAAERTIAMPHECARRRSSGRTTATARTRLRATADREGRSVVCPTGALRFVLRRLRRGHSSADVSIVKCSHPSRTTTMLSTAGRRSRQHFWATSAETTLRPASVPGA